MSDRRIRVIFLDIDGVMNTPMTWGAWSRLGEASSIDTDKVERLVTLPMTSAGNGSGNPLAVQARLVKVDRTVGLTDEDVSKAIMMLGEAGI